MNRLNGRLVCSKLVLRKSNTPISRTAACLSTCMPLDSENPTEATPLLQTPRASRNDSIPLNAPPVVDPIVDQLYSEICSSTTLLDNLLISEFDPPPQWCPDTLVSIAQKSALILVVLLRLLEKQQERSSNSSSNTWEQWSAEQEGIRISEAVHNTVLGVWNNFINEYRTTEDIEELLWLAFPLDTEVRTLIRGL